MNKLRKYFNSLNLQNKLRLCFIFLILIPSVIIGVAYYGVSYHSIIDIAKKNILDVVVKNTQLIDRQMSYIQDSAVNLNVDQELYRLLSDVETVPESELLVKDKKIQAILQKYFVDDDIVTTTIMTEKFIFGDNSQLKVPARNFFRLLALGEPAPPQRGVAVDSDLYCGGYLRPGLYGGKSYGVFFDTAPESYLYRSGKAFGGEKITGGFQCGAGY